MDKLNPIDKRFYLPIIQSAIEEDIGHGDITTDAIIPFDTMATARILAKQDLVVSCTFVAEDTFKLLDPTAQIDINVKEGEVISEGTAILEIKARARVILSAERVALNLLQRLCGITTVTHNMVESIKGLDVILLDTRKTTPGLRILEKYAVKAGGAHNHRFGLFDGVLIKDNHIAIAGSIKNAVEKARQSVHHLMKIQVEVSNTQEIIDALEAGADSLLLDNMVEGNNVNRLKTAVDLAQGINPDIILEASGGITPDNLVQTASTGVHQISSGYLSHSAPSVDISLRIDMQ